MPVDPLDHEDAQEPPPPPVNPVVDPEQLLQLVAKDDPPPPPRPEATVTSPEVAILDQTPSPPGLGSPVEVVPPLPTKIVYVSFATTLRVPVAT